VTRGKYIVIEGSDGTGKSTQVALLREKLKERGIDSIEFHEPGGLPVTDAIRNVILNGELSRDPITNLLLFTAARHELWKNARRKIKEGVWVIAARSYFSSIVYQGYGEGISQQLIRDTTLLFTDELYMQPDLAVILTLNDQSEREKRIGKRGKLATPDTFESKDDSFQQTVQEGYEQLARDYKLPLLSAQRTIKAIADEIVLLIDTQKKSRSN
jgi:dTMP kinase